MKIQIKIFAPYASLPLRICFACYISGLADLYSLSSTSPLRVLPFFYLLVLVVSSSLPTYFLIFSFFSLLPLALPTLNTAVIFTICPESVYQNNAL